MSLDLAIFRSKWQNLSIEAQKQLLSKLNTDELIFIHSHPIIFLFDKQIIEGDDWRYWILLAGRGFGKSFAGSAWLATKIMEGAKTCALAGATYDDVSKIQVPVLQSWFREEDKPVYNHQNHVLNFTKGKYKGAKILCFTSDKETRGNNIEKLWVDEICCWCDSLPDKIQERFDTIDLGVRKGKCPQTIITTTPKNMEIFRKWKKLSSEPDSIYKMTTGTSFDNPHLPQSFLQAQIDKHGNSRYGRQELYGELLEDVEGALWSHSLIDKTRISTKDFNINEMERICIAVDPATTCNITSDATGIIVAAISKGHGYILNDSSLKAPPEQWARVVVDLYHKYKANFIVAEGNQGGEMIAHVLKSIEKNLPVKIVHAKNNKIVRAEPISAIYENGKAHHVGYFEQLEKEMCLYTGDPKQKSPNSMDAMVYALTELMLVSKFSNRDFSNLGAY